MTAKNTPEQDDKPKPVYQVLLKNTRRVLDVVPELQRAKALTDWHTRRLDHPVYPPEVVVERVSPDGKRRKVWPVGVTA